MTTGAGLLVVKSPAGCSLLVLLQHFNFTGLITEKENFEVSNST